MSRRTQPDAQGLFVQPEHADSGDGGPPAQPGVPGPVPEMRPCAVAGMIVEQIRQTARLLPRPDLSGPQRPDLMPLPEVLGQLAADLRELRPRGRLAAALRQLADAIERTKAQ